MDQRTTIGTGATLGRPIHRACVVPGCWCGSNASLARSTTTRPGSATRSSRRSEAASALLTDIAWRSVGLPVA